MSEPQLVISPVLGDWLALRRVDRGHLTFHCGLVLDGGRPVPGYLVASLRLLLDRGHAVLDPPRMRITEPGRACYRELCRARGRWLATDRGVPFGLAPLTEEVHR